jgi:DNA-directed RNA polymerase specialized sigma24 family protein
MSSRKHVLQGEAFERLLAWLSSNPERAATEYVHLHQRLTKLFAVRGCRNPEDCADEAFNRVARQVIDGKEIRTTNHAAYLEGVARYILREEWASTPPEDVEDLPLERLKSLKTSQTGADEKERQQQCLERCLNQLPADARLLVLEYYSEDKSLKRDIRLRMSQRLGIEQGVLRNRIFKLRNKLRACLIECLGA